MMGNNSIMFLGRRLLRFVDCSVKTGHLMWSELAWSELAPQGMQWCSLGLGHDVVGCFFAHVAQHLLLMHLSLM